MAKKEIAKGYSNEDFRALDLSDPKSADWQRAIDIFRLRFKYRYIEPVDVLIAEEAHLPAKEKKFGFTIAAIDALLIETLACFYAGLPETPPKKNSVYYCNFMTDPQTLLSTYFDKESAELFYQHIRCGILHQSETKKDSLVWSVGPVVMRKGNGITINRTKLHQVLKDEFELYMEKLNQPANIALRENFVKKMNHICRV